MCRIVSGSSGEQFRYHASKSRNRPSTGGLPLPKGVILSNQALMAQYMGAIVDGQYEDDDLNVNALPIYHCAQRDVFLNPIFWLGGTNVLTTPDVGSILKSIAEYRATMFFAPPTVCIGMLRHPDFARFDLGSLKKCYYTPPSCRWRSSRKS